MADFADPPREPSGLAGDPAEVAELAEAAHRGREGGASNTPLAKANGPDHVSILAQGIDTIHLAFMGSLQIDVIADLRSLRERLDEQRADATRSQRQKVHSSREIAGSEFSVHAHGAAALRFMNADLTLIVELHSSMSSPVVLAQLRSGFLWLTGWRDAVTRTQEIAVCLLLPSSVARPLVSRVDLAVDVQGLRLTPEDRQHFVCRAKSRALHFDGEAFTGFSFGRGKFVARVYDKTAEILASGKSWFRDVWAARGFDPAEPVVRIEFQVRREGLKGFGISTLADLDRSATRVWLYLAKEWLRLVDVVPGLRRSRLPTRPAWAAVSRAEFTGPQGPPATRARRFEANRKHILDGLLGSLTSLAAVDGHASLDDTLDFLRKWVPQVLERRGESFSDAVRKKKLTYAEAGPPTKRRGAGT